MAASGIPTNRSNIELDPETSAMIIQKAQEKSAVMSLAQRITLPGKGLTIPVITSDPEAEWVTETGEESWPRKEDHAGLQAGRDRSVFR